MKVPIKCIGQYTKANKKCLVCVYRNFCKQYKKSEDYDSKHVPVPVDENGDPIEYEEAVDPDVYYDDVDVPFEARQFSYEDVKQIARYILDLSPLVFFVFRMKLDDPSLSASDIAKKLNFTTAEVRKAINLICDQHPELAKLLHIGCPKWRAVPK